MRRSTERILTTHTGSLPRPPDLVELIGRREAGGEAEMHQGDASDSDGEIAGG